jgi:hypothetical protein
VLGGPRRRKLAHAFLWEYIYKRLKLAQLLGRHGVSLTLRAERAGLSEARRIGVVVGGGNLVGGGGCSGGCLPRVRSHCRF